MKDSFKRATRKDLGHGGWNCPCCRDISKKKARRSARRRMKVALKKEVNRDF